MAVKNHTLAGYVCPFGGDSKKEGAKRLLVAAELDKAILREAANRNF